MGFSLKKAFKSVTAPISSAISALPGTKQDVSNVINNPVLNPVGVLGSVPITKATGLSYEDQLKTGAIGGSLAGLYGYGAAGMGGTSGAGLAGTGYEGAMALPTAGADLTAYGAGAGGTAGAFGSGVAGGTGAGLTGAAASGAGMAGGAAGGSFWPTVGAIAPSVLGYYGAKEGRDQQSELAGQYMAMGEPYRGALANLYNNPQAYYDSQRADVEKDVSRGTDILARSLSTQGNPIGSGNALQQLQSYASEGMNQELYRRLNAEKQNLANFGGLSQFNAAAPTMAQGAIKSGENMYNALGYGAGQLADIYNPPKPSASDAYWENRMRAGY